MKTGTSFWVGSEAVRRHPDIFLSFSKSVDSYERIEMSVNWLVKFKLDFLTLYFDEPDATGHRLGPNSPEYSKKVV